MKKPDIEHGPIKRGDIVKHREMKEERGITRGGNVQAWRGKVWKMRGRRRPNQNEGL